MRSVDPEAILSVEVRDQTYDLTTSDLALLVAEPPLRECDNCESTQLAWHLATRLSAHAPLDGQLKSNDVIPLLYLACEECSETLRYVEDDAELARLLAGLAR